MIQVTQIPARSDNYIYLLHETESGQTAAVDPADAEPVLRVLREKGWRLDYIFNTHHHGDHIGGNRELKQLTGCRIVAAHADRHRIPDIDQAVADGDEVKLGESSWRIIETPGHTVGHIVFYCAAQGLLFCGDTLFAMGCGRLFEGSAAQMYQSLHILKNLPPDTKVYCAHEYTLTNARFAMTLEADNPELQKRRREVEELRRQNLSTLPATIGLELATNPFLRTESPAIRKSLAMAADAEPAAVFARIRQLKDQFS
jgi:hydroxyacylglutathione hydrolase